MEVPILQVRDLRVVFPTRAGEARAVDGASFDVARARVLGLVGESGAGKSTAASAILSLVEPPGRIAGGEIRFDGRDLRACTAAQMRALRGREISMIFQNPMTSLNPVFTVGWQLCEAMRLHRQIGRAQALEEAAHLLELAGVDAPARRLKQYPHELSGGMRQRVMIAMALCCRPRLLIADEPTTALDVTVQAQILSLLRKARDELGTAILLVTHDLGVIASICDEVAVMYAGRIVERGSVEDVFYRPLHPYTRALLRATPTLEGARALLPAIPGAPPDPAALPEGCAFAPRCARATGLCRREKAQEAPAGATHRAACWHCTARTEGGVAQ